MQNIDKITIHEAFFAPVAQALLQSEHTRNCSSYTDADHLESGIRRVLERVVSGREWVQKIGRVLRHPLSVGNFFSALKSPRRAQLAQEMAREVCRQADESTGKERDPLLAHPELDNFAVYASDGPTHGASAHEAERFGKKRPVTHLYAQNLRTHSMSHLALSEPSEYKKKEHELATLKRIGGAALRMGEPKGIKVIQVYDPAVIDYQQWYTWKTGRGLYILTQEKKNSTLPCTGINAWDQHDARNIGVLKDERVGPAGGAALRRITYRDPVLGNLYKFITNEMTLPPGLIAFLYKIRWNIEKTFDVNKNKFSETKAWANSAIAKKQQACFIVIAHNMLLILERKLHDQEHIVDQKVIDKREAQLEKEQDLAAAAGRAFNSIVKDCQRITQRSFQFIRWLRSALWMQDSWDDAVTDLRPLMDHYLL